MQKEKEIIFHVGLPKTASTFLQRVVFPEFQGINFVKKHDFKNHEEIIKKSEKPVLLSTEMDIGLGRKRSEKLYEIADKYPQTKIILVLRRHDKWIASKYKYSIRKYGKLSFREYFDIYKDKGLYKKENLYYFSIIKKIEELYKQKPMLVFQEELKSEPENVILSMADFCNAKIDYSSIPNKKLNTAFNEVQLKSLLRFNRRFPFDDTKHGKFVKKIRAGLIHSVAFFAGIFKSDKNNSPLVPPEDLKKIKDYFEDDWKKCLEYEKSRREVFTN